MLRRVYRQRRRILFASTLIVLALLIADSAKEGGLTLFFGLTPFGRVVLITNLLAFIASICAALVAIMPSARPIIEVTSLAILAQATLALFMPPDLVDLMWGTGFASIMLFLLYVAVYLALYGPASDHLPTWFSTNTRQVFRVNASPEQVWRRLVPEPDHITDYWTGTLQGVTCDPEERDTVHARFALGGGLVETQSITFLDRSPPRHCCYYFICDAAGTNADFLEGEYELKITPLPEGGCEVETTLRRSAMHLRLALMMWFDDAAGDQADGIRASLGHGADWSIAGHFNRQARRAS